MRQQTLIKIFLLSLFVSVTGLAQSPKITLGATLPLTGNLASYGKLISEGISLAVEDANSKGRNISFQAEDTPLTGSGIVSSFRRLVNVSKINAMAGNFANPVVLSLASEFAKNKIIAMHTAGVDDRILAASKGWIFSTNIRIKDEAEYAAKYVYEVEKKRRVAVISIMTNFGESYRKNFIEKFKSLGGQIVSDETYQLGDTDYRAQLTRLRATNPEYVYAATFGHFLGLTLKQARQLKITAPFLSVYESEDTSVLSAASGAAEGLKYFVTYSSKSSAVAEDFRVRFIKKFSHEPGTFASNSYDASMLLIEVIVRCGQNIECMREELLAISDYEGASGTFSIGADGIANKKFYLKQIREEKFEFLSVN